SICSLFSYLALPLPPISTPFPYTTLFRSSSLQVTAQTSVPDWVRARALSVYILVFFGSMAAGGALWGFVASQASIPLALFAAAGDRKSTRLNSSHVKISYAVFCLKKKNIM